MDKTAEHHPGSAVEIAEVKDKRGAPRFTLALPIVVHRTPLLREGDLLYGKTRDVSTSGLYFTTYDPVAPGTKLQLSFGIPLDVTEGVQTLIRLDARAIRVESLPRSVFGHVGVGAAIEKFQILKAEEKPSK